MSMGETGRCGRVFVLDDEAAGGIDRGIQVGALAAQHQGVAAAGAKADGADFAVAVGLALEERNGALQIGHGLGVRHREHGLEDFFHNGGIGRAFAGVHVRGDGQVALFGETAGDVLDVVVKAEGFHDDDDAGVAPGVGRAAEIGVDPGAVLAGKSKHFGRDICWVHGCAP